MVCCKHIVICFLALFILMAGKVRGLAQSDVNLEKLTVNDGLSQGYVDCLWQDNDGFIWMGTMNGLNRYDGRRIKDFSSSIFALNSLSNNWARSIYQYEDYLVLGFVDQGINIFNKKTYQTYSLWSKDGNAWLRAVTVLESYVDKWGQIFVYVSRADQGRALLKISFPHGWPKNRDQRKIEAVITILSLEKVESGFHFSGTPDGENIWYTNGSWLKKMATKTGEIKTFEFLPSMLNKKIKQLEIEDSGAVWMTTEECIYQFNKGKWNATQLENPDQTTLKFGRNGRIYVATNGHLYICTRANFKAPLLDAESALQTISLSNKQALDILEDKSGIVWIGTNGYGVLKYNPQAQRFKVYFPGVSVNRPVFFDPQGKLSFFKRSALGYFVSPSSFSSNVYDYFKRIAGIYNAPDGSYWVIPHDAGKVSLFKGKPEEGWRKMAEFNLAINTIITVKIDGQGNVWMANTGKLFNYQLATDQQAIFDFSSIIDQKHKVFDLTQTPNGNWWIATDKGLIRGIPKEGGMAFSKIASIKNSFIHALLPDPKHPDILWLGTKGGGLNRLDLGTMKCTSITTANGLSNDVIYSILSDKNGCLWMGSNKGLIRYNPASGDVRNYTIEDGLPSNEFNIRAFAKGADGVMYFGCVEGLIAFNPDNFKDNAIKPEVRIIGLEVNNKSVELGDKTGILKESMEYSNQITLPFSQNNISLKLAALEYSNPSRNRFKYYLKGAEREWVHESVENTASYLNLAPGKYSFIVKACNSDEIWNETPAVLNITILPPWYRSNWAYAIYTLLFLGSLFGIFRFFLYRQRLGYQLVMEQKEAERLKELDDFKSKLYTNITHEFRTPLTVIQGMAEEVIVFNPNTPDPKLKKIGGLIKRNGDQLLQLINQILDLSKLEANSLKLNPEPGDLVGFIRYLAGSFESVGSNRGIKIHFQTNQDKIYMWLDKERLQTIFSNLISNALKFTGENGRIEVSIQDSPDWKQATDQSHFLALSPLNDQNETWVSITVKDNGPGIAATHLPHIFNRFFQADNQQNSTPTGTGIGLALVKELVQLMQGAIAVSSSPQTGTSFVIVLPIIQDGLPEEQEAEIADSERGETIVAVAEPKTAQNDGSLPSKEHLPLLLLVEDNADVLQYLTFCVEDSYRVMTAVNGQEGIDKALEMGPDIIISDVMMPIKDGFELVKTIKNDERTSHIPIVLLTAKTDDSSRIEGLERGADAYLSKPFNKQELLVRLRKLLELRAILQQRYASGQLITASPATASSDLGSYEDLFFAKLQKILTKNIEDEDFGIAELCKALDMSRTQLHSKIKALTGKSTTLYIRSFRLQKASALLLSTTMTISEIAYAVGFRHAQNLSTYFSEEFGYPPSKLRK